MILIFKISIWDASNIRISEIHIRGIQLKKPPLFKKPPLVTPRSATRGGFLKKVSLFSWFCCFFRWKSLQKHCFCKENRVLGDSKSPKFSPAARCQPIIYYHRLSSIQVRYWGLSLMKKQKFWKHLRRSETLWNVQKSGFCRRRRKFFGTLY